MLKKILFTIFWLLILIWIVALITYRPEKKEDKQLCNHENNIDQLNCIISEKEKEMKMSYETYEFHKWEAKSMWDIYQWQSKHREELFTEKIRMFSWMDTVFSADRE